MADWRTTCEQLKALVLSVNGIDIVFDYPPDLREPKKFKDLATTWDDETNLPIINVWFVERVSAQDVRGHIGATVPLTRAIRQDTYRITGLYGYAKGGQTMFEFQALVESVLDALLPEVTIDQSSWWVAKAAALRRVDLREFGDYLCHVAEIELEVTRPVAVTFK